MADELDVVTRETVRTTNSGDQQSASLRPNDFDPETVDALDKLLADSGHKPEGDDDDKTTLETDTDGDTPTGDKAGAKTGSKEDAVHGGGEAGDDSDPRPSDDSNNPQDDSGGAAGGTGDDDDAKSDNDKTDADVSGDVKGDSFDKIVLPPHTSQKASDSFNAVKEKARAEIAERDKKIGDLERRVSDFEGRQTVTPEEKKELEELRRFRSSVEIEYDPEIKKSFDDKISAQSEEIYLQLKAAGMTDEQVKKMKAAGGPHKLTNWDDIYEHLTGSQRRAIDKRLNAIEGLVEDRNKKTKEAKENVDKLLESKTTQAKQQEEARAQVLEKTANEMLQGMIWSAVRKAGDKATDNEKKEVEEHNKSVDKSMGLLKQLLLDRSPENHAEMAVAAVQALHIQKMYQALEAERNGLVKQVAELSAKLNKIKKASSPRSGGAPTQALRPKSDSFNESAEDALDRLRLEVSPD